MRNITALGNLITWQKVDYDFSYHQMEFPCNINVLIASEGRSLLPVRTHARDAVPDGREVVLLTLSGSTAPTVVNLSVSVTPQSDCHVPLQPQLPPPNMEEYMGALQAALPLSLLNKFRIYLTALRHQEYSISEALTKVREVPPTWGGGGGSACALTPLRWYPQMVEEDFVEMRKEDPQSISADDLHRTLVVARYVPADLLVLRSPLS